MKRLSAIFTILGTASAWAHPAHNAPANSVLGFLETWGLDHGLVALVAGVAAVALGLWALRRSRAR